MEAVNVKLLKQSETDQMTGLANRYRLNAYSEKVLDYCYEHRLPLAMEILDIDFSSSIMTIMDISGATSALLQLQMS